MPARGELGLAVITQPVLVEAHRAGAGLLVELPGSGHGSSLLVRSGASPGPRAVHNTSWLYAPDGARATYHKRLLVPFGEYLPWRPVLGWLKSLTPAPDLDRVPGSQPV